MKCSRQIIAFNILTAGYHITLKQENDKQTTKLTEKKKKAGRCM